MSCNQGPGVSMFQGAESLSLEINGKSPEEEEDMEDEKRRKDELCEMLKSAFDDLNTDDDSSVADSHYSGVSHPHQTSTACENIQPSISPCEVDYNKVIEFESRPDDSQYCLNRSTNSKYQAFLADKYYSCLEHYNNTLVCSSSSSTHHGLTTPSHSPGITSSSMPSPLQTTSAFKGKVSRRRVFKPLRPDDLDQNPQESSDLSPPVGFTEQYLHHQNPEDGGLMPSGNGPLEAPDTNQIFKFKQLERQYEKRVRELEDLHRYKEQMNNKYDENKVDMEVLLQREHDKEMLNIEVKCSEEEKKRMLMLEREIQELRENVNNLVRVKENTSKELDVSRVTIYDLQQTIAQLEQKKNVSKGMRNYERIIEQMKTDSEKQKQYYRSVQSKVSVEFDRLKGELEKIRSEKNKMVVEINRSVEWIRTKLLEDPGYDFAKLKEELGNEEGVEDECGVLSVIKILERFLHQIQQSDKLESLRPCQTSLEGDNTEPQPSMEPDTAPNTSILSSAVQEIHTDSLQDEQLKSSLPSIDTSKDTSPTNQSLTESKALSTSTTLPVPTTSSGKSPKENNEAPASPAAGTTSSGSNKNNNLVELNSILLDRLKKREGQLKSMTVECLNMSEVHFDSMKAVMNDFVRYHFAESLRNVSKPPKDTSAETIAHMIDQERRKDDLLKEFLDNFRAFISEKKKEKLKHIQEIQADFSNLSVQESNTEPATCTTQELKEKDEQLRFDLKKMKDSFVNEINHVREEYIKLGKENETLRNKCEDYQKKNISVMEELVTLRKQMRHEPNSEVVSSSNNSNNKKKKGKSKNCNKSGNGVSQDINGSQRENETSTDSMEPEDLSKDDKDELLKALITAHNEIRSKDSLLHRMECDYHDKMVEIEQHSVDLYAEQVQQIKSKQQSLLPQIEGFRESLKEHVQLIKNQKAEIQELRLRDSVLTMENQRLNQKLEDMLKKKKLEFGVDSTNQNAAQEANENEPVRDLDEDNNDFNVSLDNINTIEYQIKFQLEYEKLRDVCKQWSDEVRELRHRLAASEAGLEALRVKYKSIRKCALGYKGLAAEREKRLLEEKESHKAHLNDIQVKMAKTIHKREAEINAKIAEIEKCNNEKLKVIMMLQRTAENNGKAIINQLNKAGKSKKCTNENVNPDAELNAKTNNVKQRLTNGDVEEMKNNANMNMGKKNNNKVNNASRKVDNIVTNNGAKAVSLKKKKTEL